MAITRIAVPGGPNGFVHRYNIQDGDSLRLRPDRLLDFLDRGVVFTVRPAAGATVKVYFAADPELIAKVESAASPITEDAAFHQITPFNSVEVAAEGGEADIDILIESRQNAQLIPVP